MPTSVSGIGPQFAATKPNSSSNVRPLHAAKATSKLDSVHFGGNTSSTDTSTQTDKPSFAKKSWNGIKEGIKHAFQPSGLAWDLGIGTILAIATAIIPPHLHALAMIPFAFLVGGLLRFAQGAIKGFKATTAD